jgi:hypothetical protein
MSELTDLQAAALEVLLDLGTTATLQVVSATYDNAGTVTETVTTETVYCSDLQGESSQFVADGTSRRAFGSVYVAASGMTNTPAPGQRLVYQTRRFEITGVEPYRVQGGVAAYRLDVSELGAV